MQRGLRLLAIGFLLIGSTAAWTMTDENKIFPFPYQMKDLPNGLRVIVVDTGLPNIVSLQIPVQTGSRNEVEPGKSGFAHFFEHMMFRGTDKYSSTEYAEILKNIGADQNAYTTDDYTNYHITFSKEDLDTVLMLEADRFMNLNYKIEDFKTEARAVLGEYNKNYANPFQKMFEVIRDNAYTKHTYKHTTMGFIRDIEDMPNQYEYSLEFFKRFYRPEKSVIILAGDVDAKQAFGLVEKYWGAWERGNYNSEIPVEPPPTGPKYKHVSWNAPTLPILMTSFRGPAASETELDMAAMNIIGQIAFSQSSDLYNKLVLNEQKVQTIFPYFAERIDPGLLYIGAMVKNPADIWYVRDEIQKTLADLRVNLVSEKRLWEIKSAFKYGFANSLDNTAGIAGTFASYVARNRDPESINRSYALYDKVTPEIIRDMAKKYFVDQSMLVTTLSSTPLPENDKPEGSVDDIKIPLSVTKEAKGATGDLSVDLKAMKQGKAEIETLLIRNQASIINFRILFNVGSVNDPEGKKGLAALTAAMVSGGGSQTMSFEEIQAAMYPMAAGFGGSVDKEMTVFQGTSHRDTLNRYYDIIRGQLLTPGWKEEDLNRIKNNMINGIKISLRSNDDEELGKEVLYQQLYKGHPYEHFQRGHISSLESITMDDIKAFYAAHYTRTNLVLGMAGNIPNDVLNIIKTDLGSLPEGTPSRVTLPAPSEVKTNTLAIVKKETRATGIHFGYTIDVTRGHEDFAALWLIRSYLGEHRSFNGRMFQNIREKRGLNYGDYAYIEYFPGGGGRFHPPANIARRSQIFQMWIRPVPPEKAHFALRIAKYELDQTIQNGLTKEEFEATRNYLVKFANVLTASQSRQLGYALDSQFYGIKDFPSYIRESMEKLTVEKVNKAMRKHLRNENLQMVIVTKDAEGLKDAILAGKPSPITYDANKSQEIKDEDKIIEAYKIDIKPENITILEQETIFQ